MRTLNEEIRTRVLAAIKRILEAEAQASGATQPPAFSVLGEFPLTRNNEAATHKAVAALVERFGGELVMEVGPATASEDFGLFGTSWDVPTVFWVAGSIDPQSYDKAKAAGKLAPLPANHAPDSRASAQFHAAHGRGGNAGGCRCMDLPLRYRRHPDLNLQGEVFQGLIRELDMVGTLVFALSGGLLGVKKRFDIFGVLSSPLSSPSRAASCEIS